MHIERQNHKNICQAIVILTLMIILVACRPDQSDAFPRPTNAFTTATPSPTALNQQLTPTVPSQKESPTHTSFPTLTQSASNEPQVCQKPSDDYSRVEINGHQLNRRTYEMLALAQVYYAGAIDLTGDAITQGSYTSAVEASFGTHAGGGAVDLSVMAPGTHTILHSDIITIIKALRKAGFAAWYRDFDVLYDGSAPHIHAIAIGDRELSLAAREQLAGPHGYFWGYDGLPVEDGLPTRDPHGRPVMCDWMIEKGYPNKTTTPSPEERTPQP